MQQKISQKLHSLAFFFTSLTIFLTPFIFIPAFPWASSSSKMFILSIGAFFAFTFWILSQFSEGVITITRRRSLGILTLWQIILAVGVFFSSSTKLALWGRGVSMESLVGLFSFSLLVFLISQFASDKQRNIKIFFSLFISLSLVLVLQILFTAFRFTPFISNFFNHLTFSGTLIGSWTDFSYATVFLYGIALLTYELYTPSKILKRISLGVSVLSLIVLVFLNIKFAWLFIFISTVIIFLYRMIAQERQREPIEGKEVTRFPTLPFASLLISLFFLLSSPLVSGFFARTINFSFNDVKPSIASSLSVAQKTVASNPLFGNGMGTYQDLWDLYKTTDVNNTVFWNTSFPTSFNFPLTIAATQGLLSVILFVFFIFSIFILIKRIIRSEKVDAYTTWIRSLTIFSSLLFVSILFVHSPTSSPLFVIGAWAIGTLLVIAPLPNKPFHVIQYLQDPRKSFFALSGMLFGILLSFAAVFYSINIFIGTIVYSWAIRSSEPVDAISRITSAIQINQNDLYHRVRASLLLSQFNTLSQNETTDPVLIQNIYREAIASGSQAVQWHSGSAINWLLLSQIYQVAASGENTQFYEEAKKAAENAQQRNPFNPVLQLNLAQTALTQKKDTDADQAIARAKELKADYLDAYLLKGQVRKTQGEANGFIVEITNFLEKAPRSADGYALLSEAYAEQNQYTEAINSIVRAQQLDTTNLGYFGSYIALLERAGQKDRAIRELEAFKQAFPQITGVDEKITELRNQPTSEIFEPEISLENNEE